MKVSLSVAFMYDVKVKLKNEKSLNSLNFLLTKDLSQLEMNSFLSFPLIFRRPTKNLVKGTVIIRGDFADHHHFLVQDAAQGFHWSNYQATIHSSIFIV